MLEFISKNLFWNNEAKASLLILLALLGFILFWFISHTEKIHLWFYRKYSAETASEKHFFFGKSTGFVFMGLLPFLIVNLIFPENNWNDYGLVLNKEKVLFSLLSILVLVALALPLVYNNAKKTETLKQYPQIRTKEWTHTTIFINITGWVLYLFGYEFLFRGILLFPLTEMVGILPAIAINTALYSATHLPKGPGETIGAIPLGILFCLLTLYTGMIWIALIVHIAIALTNSFVALKFQPEMRKV